MLKKIAPIVIMACTTLTATPAHSEEGQELTADERTVLATVETMTSNLEGGDVDGIMSTYQDGAAIMFEPGRAVADPALARQIFAQMVAAKPKVTYGAHEVYVSGDTAIHIAPWSMVGTGPDGVKFEQGGLSVAVLRLQADGSWKMVIDNPHGARLLSN